MPPKDARESESQQADPTASLARRLAAGLTVRLPDGAIFETKATLLSPRLAVTALRAFAKWGVQAGAGGWISIWPGYTSTRRIPITVEVVDEALDFAILRLASPVTDAPSGFISPTPSPVKSKWSSFVEVEVSGKRQFVNLEGWFVGQADINNKRYMQLNVRSPEKFSYEEISGAAVMIENQLAGIVALGNEQEQLLYAVPISAMIESKVTDAVRGLASGRARSSSRTSGSDWTTQETIDRFSEETRAVLARAKQVSLNYKRKRVHIEHVLLALAERTDGQLRSLIAELTLDLLKFLEPGIGATPEGAGEADDGPPEFSGMSAMSANARRAMVTAIERANADGLETIAAAHLLFGVLSTTKNPQVAELNKRGITPARVLLPLPAAVLAGYQSDDPSGTDLLGITEEVKALASVMAAKTVEPPLSLGLFGDWGTGKSFFMNKLEVRIRKLAKDASEDEKKNIESPYCSSVLQITFNAWNYIDSDLWASLAAEIFENLAAAIVQKDEKEDSPEKRAQVLASVSSSLTSVEDAERKKGEAEAELGRSEERLANLQKSKVDIETELTKGQLVRELVGFALEDQQVKDSIGRSKTHLELTKPMPRRLSWSLRS